MLPWLSLLWLVLQKKTKQFGIFVFVEVQETNGGGKLQGSKCDGDFIFLWKCFSFYDKVSSYLDLVRVFLKYFHPNLPCDVFNRSLLFNMQCVKIFSLVCSVFKFPRHEQVRLIRLRFERYFFHHLLKKPANLL